MDVGVQFQNYEIIEHIGRGGMADVWSARDTSLGRMVAVKTIARDLSADGTDSLAMFEQEARTIASLEHPHVLPIYGFGQVQGKLYIAMRYITGGSLDDVLKDRPMTYARALRVGRYIADALDYAHSQSVVHLDLKPPNILMDSKGTPYLADFGLATSLGADGQAKNPGAGTLLYMAPEQITSDHLDHRADIYSFAIVLFHMFTGQLPFNGTAPLSLHQIRTHEELPSVTAANPDLPDGLTDILQRGTSLYSENRYETVREMMVEVEQVMGGNSPVIGGAVRSTEEVSSTNMLTDMLTDFDPERVQLREAEDIYNRAYLAWDSGNGRFLLSVTHFMVMSDFYINADHYGLTLDENGFQVFLRGALEYDYHLDHWWSMLSEDDDSRRWVCLHTIRSETPQARIRAYDRLHTLPDTHPPVIPGQVAQALSLENHAGAAAAALDVLGTRSRYIESVPDYQRGGSTAARITNNIIRERLQFVSDVTWREFAYSPEIDARVAEMALDGVNEKVEAQAARVIGKLRSKHAVQLLLNARRSHKPGTLRAMAYVLDEVPVLPEGVPPAARVRAWLMNTTRRLTENPMGIVWAFVGALMGGWFGMGQHVYRTFRSQDIFDQLRVLNTYAIGLLFGFFLAILTLMAKVLPERLRGFWPNWTRLLWSGLSGYYLSQLLWWAYVWAYLNLDSPPKDILVLTGLGTAIGFVVPAMVKMRGWQAFLLTVATTFGVHWVGFNNFWESYYGSGSLGIRFWWPRLSESFPFVGFEQFVFTDASWIFAYDFEVHVWTIMLPMMILFAVGVHLPALVQDSRDLAIWLFGRSETKQDKDFSSRRDNSMTTLTPQRLEKETPQTPLAVAVDNGSQTRQLREQKPATNLEAATLMGAQDILTEEFELDRVGGHDGEYKKDPKEQTMPIDRTNPLAMEPATRNLGASEDAATPPTADFDDENNIDQKPPTVRLDDTEDPMTTNRIDREDPT
jgi:serine/threonine protein kinase